MRFESLILERFGMFEGASLDFGGGGLHGPFADIRPDQFRHDEVRGRRAICSSASSFSA